ncbi:hypothetical protein AGABI2DRAFT_122285 [Agaricus bisporus var. bisporus H97]|uniref:hypothetical protein n=1 Tax=Agaricus bisporus var. bisporus (strain H97 / ATCC MYA-4626 / FGSC 10389) TaxID=936046 RepID=UPI00029F53A9|nr:hypothetical protein AGABI2DRAFT_122285 [Agaricus bisporus var. bisporus H97]EKV42697.1 hypothetical protein AGABI2DRAFT_122285 [Agaricus bisporus var. bisporus H97]
MTPVPPQQLNPYSGSHETYPGDATYMPVPSPATIPTSAFPDYSYPQQQQMPAPDYLPRAEYQYQASAPAPQVIIVKHSHRQHNRLRKKSHSHSNLQSYSQSQPIVLPQPITYSNSQPIYTQSPTVAYPQIQYQSNSHHQYRRSEPNASHERVVSPNRPSYPAIAPAHHKSDGRFVYSKCTGRKKALCIGINYHGQSHELRGCINDARNVRKFLINNHGYKNEDIVLLTDDTSEPRHLPTRQNLIDAMRWLVRSARPDDSLFFHYSGHGGQIQDKDGDEMDGFDEVIFPLDFKQTDVIVDDEMHAIMVANLPEGCRLTALFDSCHSGTVLDLPYIYSSHGRLKGDHVKAPARKRKVTCADVISWSGCEDGQNSADTFRNGVAVGAMSNAFIHTLLQQPDQSYRDLLRTVRKILRPKYNQTPQLGSSHHIDTSLKFVI